MGPNRGAILRILPWKCNSEVIEWDSSDHPKMRDKFPNQSNLVGRLVAFDRGETSRVNAWRVVLYDGGVEYDFWLYRSCFQVVSPLELLALEAEEPLGEIDGN